MMQSLIRPWIEDFLSICRLRKRRHDVGCRRYSVMKLKEEEEGDRSSVKGKMLPMRTHLNDIFVSQDL